MRKPRKVSYPAPSGHDPKLEPSSQATDPNVTTKEAAELKNWVARARARAGVKLKASDGEIVPDHPDQKVGWALVMNALGTVDPDFANGLIGQLARVNEDGLELNVHGLNFMLSIITGLEPRNQLEALIGAHLAIIEVAFMKTARCLTFTENVFQHDSVALNKLSRTFVMLVDTLHRSRTGAPQTVQNVSVAFGQAIVANVKHPMSETISERDGGSPPTGGENNAVPLPTAAGQQHLSGVAGHGIVRPAVGDEEDSGLPKKKIRAARARARRS